MHYNKLEEIMRKLRSKGHHVDSVFDVGANEGSWTKHWKKIYPEASFSLFEANPLHSRPKFLSQSDRWINQVVTKPGVEEITFYRMPNREHRGTGDSYYIENTPHYRNAVPTILKASTLDDLVEREKLKLPQLIKLDTQGSEVDILSGAEKTFKNVEVCICEVPVVEYNKGAPSFDKYLEKFKSLGFSPNAIDQDHHSHGLLIQIDIVFVKTDLLQKII